MSACVHFGVPVFRPLYPVVLSSMRELKCISGSALEWQSISMQCEMSQDQIPTWTLNFSMVMWY